jgi:hypothetical protein
VASTNFINYLADFFQTCIDDQAGYVNGGKENIFPCNRLYQNYGPLLISILKFGGINSSLTIMADFFQTHR